MARREGFYANPNRQIEEPVVVKDDGPLGGTRATHPAFGQIGAFRVQGQRALYGSDFLHHNYMVVRICRSELHRSLSRDWTHGRDELIEVCLSEAQWATFVSAAPIGEGVQCTIGRIDRALVPELPDPTSRADQFSDEVKETLADALKALDEAIALADEGKVKLSIRERLRKARQELSSNIPFVAEQFSEHTEVVIEKAKAEIHGYMVGAINRAGLDALRGDDPPLLIDSAAVSTESPKE